MSRAPLLLAFGLALSRPVCSANGGQFNEEELRVGGSLRSYATYTPAGLDSKRPAPLVVALHGGLGDATRLLNNSTLRQLADRRHVLLLLPESQGRAWIDARDESRASEQDVVFIEALVDHVRRTRNIDAQRVYLTGLSSGGEMTFRLALQRPNLFAAFATVSANLSSYMLERLPSTGPVPILMINGTADPLMPFDSGQIGGGFGRDRLGTVISAPDTARFWARANGCDANPTTTTLPDVDPTDGTRVRRSEFPGCKHGAHVVAMTIEGGGHSWPGAEKRALPTTLAGPLTRDIDAADVIWEFFESHRGRSAPPP